MRKIVITLFVVVFCLHSKAQVPVNISSLPNNIYTENFNDIANWTFIPVPLNGIFTSGIGAAPFKGNDVNATGFIPSGTRITTPSLQFQTPPSGNQGYSGGVYKGSGNLIFLSTGTSDNTTSISMDLFLNFAGVNAGTLSFDWATLNNGAGTRNASFKVYATIDGTNFSEITGAQVSNFTNNILTTGTVSNITLPSTFNNNANARLRFYYHNGSGGVSGGRPRFGIDNIKITGLNTTPCTTPTAQPTALNISSITNVAMQISYTPAIPAPQNYLVVMSNNASLSSNPVNGVNYSIDDNLGDGSVIAITNSTSINVTNLIASTRYYFFIFSVNNACTGGPIYLTLNSLSNNAITLSGPIACTAPLPQATNLIFSNISTSSITGTFTKSTSIIADEYVIIRTTAPNFTGNLNSGSTYSGGQLIGNGSIVTRTTNNTFTANNLTNGTTYYFFVFAVNNKNCNGGPVYNNTTPLIGNVNTISLPTCVEPNTQPTSINLKASNTMVTGYFNPTTTADSYIILRSNNNTISNLPLNNLNYALGSTLGNATVISNAATSSFIDVGLTASTTNYYYVIAKNSTCNGGTKYLSTNPLQGTIATTSAPTENFYYGTLHAHSSYSDGNVDNLTLTPLDNFNYAKNSLCMDFLGISDHNHATAGMSLPNYALGLTQATAATSSNFLALYGMEWGVISNGGHVCVYGSPGLVGWENNNYNTFIAKSNYLGKPETTSNTGLFRYLNTLNNNAFATLAHPNNSDYENILDKPFDSNADSAIAGSAVTSGIAFSTNTSYNDPPFSFSYIDYYMRMLAKGYHLGPTMDHDSHNTNFGRANNNRTALVMPSLNSQNFYSAMKNKSFYATEDCDTRLHFSINNMPMGSQFSGNLAPNINAYIIDPTNPNGTVSIKLMFGIPGNSVLPVQIASSNTNKFSYTDFDLPVGTTGYYYIDVTIDGVRTMSSPIWYNRTTLVPIQLKSFTALLNNNNCNITFEITNEQNILSYVVEKSIDGINFYTLESIINKQISKYKCTDYNLKTGITYYRLKTINQNGKIDFSNTISINNTKTFTQFKVFPNPIISSFLNLSINSTTNTKSEVRISDVYGRIIFSKPINIEVGLQTIYLDNLKISKGIYTIETIIDGKKNVEKIFKL